MRWFRTSVLEIGTGTGYNTALLCELTAPENIVAVDHPALQHVQPDGASALFRWPLPL